MRLHYKGKCVCFFGTILICEFCTSTLLKVNNFLSLSASIFGNTKTQPDIMLTDKARVLERTGGGISSLGYAAPDPDIYKLIGILWTCFDYNGHSVVRTNILRRSFIPLFHRSSVTPPFFCFLNSSLFFICITYPNTCTQNLKFQ